MHGLGLGVDTVHGDFHAVAHNLVDHSRIFHSSGADLGFGFIQLPSTQTAPYLCSQDAQEVQNHCDEHDRAEDPEAPAPPPP